MKTTKANEPFNLTIVSKLKHGELFAAAKKCGSQAALAKKLNVSDVELRRWCNLQKCPPEHPTPAWSAERIRTLELQLLELTGKLMEDLFPKELRLNIQFLNSSKTFELTRHVERCGLEHLSANYTERITHDPVKEAEKKEVRDLVRSAVSGLGNQRDRAVLEDRFGLITGVPLTLKDTADKFNLTKSRIKQIEDRAIRQIREINTSELFGDANESAKTLRRMMEEE